MRLALACIAGAVAAVAGAAPASAALSPAVHPYRLTTSGQAVVVSAPAWGASTVRLTTYTWAGTGWRRTLGPVTAYIGTNGFTATPREADDFTPVGEYGFTFAFGSNANPGTAMPYLHATDDDHWVDDPSSPAYNTYQRGDGTGRWSSAETLSNYSYAAAFDFNQGPVVPGANSAIFLHGGDEATPGCIAVDGDDLLAILRWLNPTARPVIVLGVNVGPPVHPVPPTTTTAAPATTAPAPTTTVTPPPATVPPTPMSTPASSVGATSASTWPVELFAGAMAVLAFVPLGRRRRMMRK